VLEVELGLPQSRLVLADLGHGRQELGLGDLEGRLGRSHACLLRLLLRLVRVVLGERGVVDRLGCILVGLGDEALDAQVALPPQVALGIDHRHLTLGGLGAGDGLGRARIAEVGLGTLHGGLLVEHRRLCGIDLRFDLVDLGLEDLRVDAGDDLVLLDLGVEVGVELLDLAGNLGADQDRDDRVQRAGGGDGRGDRAACDGGGAEGGLTAHALRVEVAAGEPAGQEKHEDDPEDTALHHCETGGPPKVFLTAAPGSARAGRWPGDSR
jgi:hypothetical protein